MMTMEKEMEANVQVVEVTGIGEGKPVGVFRVSDEDGVNPEFSVSQAVPNDSPGDDIKAWITSAQGILARRPGKASATVSNRRDYGLPE